MTRHNTGPTTDPDAFPLTPMQRLMLVHEVSHPGSAILTNQFSFDLRGSVDTHAFTGAWHDLVARHEALRTAFQWESLPQPVQVACDHSTLDVTVTDMRRASRSERATQLDTLRDLASRPFDITRSPLMRVALARVGENVWTLYWSCHHLVVDRWCFDILFRDLAELYAARLESRVSNLPVAGSFREHVDWVERQPPEDAAAFWRATLRGFRQPSLVTATHTPVVVSRPRYRTVVRDLQPALGQELDTLARHGQVSLSTVLLGALGLWLAQTVGRSDVVLGLTVAGRPPDLPDATDTVGCFVNSIPVRMRMRVTSDETTMRLTPWLQSIQRASPRRQRYEWVSARQIRSLCNLAAAAPLFDVLVVLNPTTPDAVRWPGFTMRPMSASLAAAHPLMIAASRNSDGGLHFTATHDEGKVRRRHADQILDEIVRTMTALPARSQARLSELVSLPEGRQSVGPTTVSPVASVVSNPTSPARALLDIWHEVLGVPVDLDHDLFALGLTSLQAVQGFAEIERRLGRPLPLSTLFETGSVRHLLAVLDDPEPASSPLVEIQPHGEHSPLVVVPGECGELLGLAGLARALGPNQPFYGLQSRGLDGRTPPRATVEEIGTDFAEAIKTGVSRPCVILGLATGALMALETALQLTAHGRPPVLLAVMNPPPLTGPPLPRLSLWGTFLAERMAFHWHDLCRADLAPRRGPSSGRATPPVGESDWEHPCVFIRHAHLRPGSRPTGKPSSSPVLSAASLSWPGERPRDIGSAPDKCTAQSWGLAAYSDPRTSCSPCTGHRTLRPYHDGSWCRPADAAEPRALCGRTRV